MLKAIARRSLLVLSAGYILMFFSEHLFWARFRPGQDSLGNYLSTWIAYSLAGYATLAVVSLFRVRRAAAVFLAGAFFGWLTEGVIVGTVYDMLPLSISFTGLAWHAPISVGIGFWLIPRILGRRRILVPPTAIGIGFFFGAWGMNWNANELEYHAPVPEFFLFSAAATCLLILAYAVFLWARKSPAEIRPAEGIGLAGLAAFFFFFRAIAQPVALCVLPVLMGITFLALWRNRRTETGGSLLAEAATPAPAWALAVLAGIPAAAAAVYAPAAWIGLKIQTNVLFYLILTPLGFILYFLSLIRIFRDRGGRTPGDHGDPPEAGAPDM